MIPEDLVFTDIFVNMNIFTVLLTILSLRVTRINAALVKKFDVQKDTWNADRSTTLYSTMAASLLDCSMMCASDKSCCSADYNQVSGECFIGSICSPQLETNSNSFHIEKIQDGISCADALATTGVIEDCDTCSEGVYTIHPQKGTPVEVFCEKDLSSGYTWTVVQRRIDGTVDFFRTWNEYKSGFGNTSGEYWLGNDHLHALTHSKTYILRFDMEDFYGNTAYAEYSTFQVGDEATKYMLTVDGYSGTAGDSLVLDCPNTPVNGSKFTTFDQDNDDHEDLNCAAFDVLNGAMWYGQYCACCNINARYQPAGFQGSECIIWESWKWADALKSMSMKLRPS